MTFDELGNYIADLKAIRYNNEGVTVVTVAIDKVLSLDVTTHNTSEIRPLVESLIGGETDD